jgi:sugar phosphate isomerase/epimerase
MDDYTGFSRRSFLALSAAAFFNSRLSHAKGAGSSVPVVAGIQLYMVSEDLNKNPANTLEELAKIGYREVETAGFANRSASDFGKLVAGAGLHAPSAHLGFGMEDTAKLLDDAMALGAPNVVSSVLPPRNVSLTSGYAPLLEMLNSMTGDDFKRTAARANEIGQKAKANGLQYSYHNHNFEFRDLGGGQIGYDILLHETDPSVVKFEADCGWMVAGGSDPIRYFKDHPGRFSMIHVKDFKDLSKPYTTLDPQNRPVSAELGHGSINYGPIVAAARRSGVAHFFVEQEPPFVEMPALQAAQVNFAALEPLLRRQ